VKFHVPKIITAVILALSASVTAFAISPGEYRKAVDASRLVVRDARIGIERNRASGTPDEGSISLVTQLLPADVQIDSGAWQTNISHKWLHDHIARFEASSDSSEKARILAQLDERLAAISISIEELEKTGAEPSKDQAKRTLAEILSRDEYQKPKQKEESRLEKFIVAISEWFAGLFPKPQGGTPEMPQLGGFAWILRGVVIVAIVLLFGFGLYRLIPLILPSRRRTKQLADDQRVVLGETISAEQSSATLFAEAEDLALSGDLRMAVRKGYIAALCELADRRLIGLARHKTNRDYLRSVRTNPELHASLSGMTEIFERHWYGFEAAEPRSWSDFREWYNRAVSDGGSG
jgi:hypothetical protein